MKKVLQISEIREKVSDFFPDAPKGRSKTSFKNVFSFLIGHAFAIAVLATLVSIRFISNFSSELPAVSQGFYYSYSFGNYWLITMLATLLVAAPWLKFGFKKVGLTLTVIFDTLFLLLLTADTFVYQLYHFHINWTLLELAINGGTQVMVISLVMVVKGLAATAGVCLVMTALVRMIGRIRFTKSMSVLMSVVALTTVVSTNVWHAYAKATQNYQVVAMTESIPMCHPLQMRRFLVRTGIVDKNLLSNDVNLKLTHVKGLNYPLSPLVLGQAGDKKLNVVVVMVDALRYDMLNTAVMPKTRAFADKAQVFTQYYSAGNATQPGVFSFFTGLPADYWPLFLQEGRSSALMDAFAKADYKIGIFTSAQLNCPEFSKTIFSRIPNLRTQSRGDRPYERDLDALADFKAWLPQNGPFFSFVFFDAAHGYDAPVEHELFGPSAAIDFSALSKDTDPTLYLNRYKSAAHFDDTLIAEVIESLKAKGHLDDTVIMITADHGEAFNDFGKNYWGHGSHFGDPLLHVPFILYWPGQKPGVNTRLTSSIDVVPTLMQEVLHCSNRPTDYTVGTSIMTAPTRDWRYGSSYTVRGFVTPERIYKITGSGQMKVFDKNLKRLWNEPVPSFYPTALEELSRFRRR